jgi:hypothetical protein
MIVGSYNYLCNQCLSPLMLGVLFWLMARCTSCHFCDKVCQWLAAGQWFSLVTYTNKTDGHDITEILLKVALNTLTHRAKIIQQFITIWTFIEKTLNKLFKHKHINETYHKPPVYTKIYYVSSVMFNSSCNCYPKKTKVF